MVEVSRTRGEHVQFRYFYEQLTAALADIMMTEPANLPGSEIIHAEPFTMDGIYPADPEHSKTGAAGLLL